MKESTKDQIAGKVKEIKGDIKQRVGGAMNRPDVQGAGAGEKLAGKAQKKVGQVEKVFNH